MNFAERNGFEKPKEIQLYSIDRVLLSRLYNLWTKLLNGIYNQDVLCYIVDKMGYITDNYSNNEELLRRRFCGLLPESNWYDPYTLFELLLQGMKNVYGCDRCDGCETGERFCGRTELMQCIPATINTILEEEKSGYRLFNWAFVPITDSEEIAAIEDAMNTGFSAAGKHISKALEQYSKRESPDYENSIKESISAVESICCYITDSKVTLSDALKMLEKKGLVIHASLKEAFIKLYGYTCDTSGIRHGGIDFVNAAPEDAKYMLVSCSAFVNYLADKYIKIKGAE